MKAAIVRVLGSVAIEDIPEPQPGPYQALAKVLCWATCNSTDYRVVQGNMGWNTSLPTLLGHETVGQVISLGAKVRHIAPGDVRLRVTAIYPGQTMAGYSSALGSFSEYGLVTDTQAMLEDGLDVSGLAITHFLHQRVPPGMDPADAAMIINLRESLSWVKRLDVAGKAVLVLGDGPVGLGFVQAALVCGANPVILVGHRAERLALGRDIGAHQAVNSTQESYRDATLDLTGGQGVDVLVDCTGDQKTLAEALNVVKPEGKVAAYGSPKIPPTGPKPEDARLVSISTDEAGTHDEVLGLIAAGNVNPRHFWSDRLHYTQIGEAIRRIATRQAVAKVVLDL